MPLLGLENSNLKLILFGGKGGVGKTSCAAATAVELSQKFRTLLISTDPAHSLSDSLCQRIGDKLQDINNVPNLSGIEIAADKTFEDFKQRHKTELKKLFDTSSNLDSEDINQLMTLSIPGIDEMMSLKTIIDFIQEGAFEKYVIDTAPTGHVLRLLSSPKILDQWIKVAVQMRWKYRYLITNFSGSYHPDETDDMLLELKKTVKRIEILLSDSKQCEFIPVCIPEAMAVNETGELLSDLKNYGVPVKQMIVNHVMDFGTCSFCVQRRMSQQKYLDQIREMYGIRYKVVHLPLFPTEIRGQESMNALRKILFSADPSVPPENNE